MNGMRRLCFRIHSSRNKPSWSGRRRSERMRSKLGVSVSWRAAALTELTRSTSNPFLRNQVCIMVAKVRSSSTIRMCGMALSES